MGNLDLVLDKLKVFARDVKKAHTKAKIDFDGLDESLLSLSFSLRNIIKETEDSEMLEYVFNKSFLEKEF